MRLPSRKSRYVWSMGIGASLGVVFFVGATPAFIDPPLLGSWAVSCHIFMSRPVFYLADVLGAGVVGLILIDLCHWITLGMATICGLTWLRFLVKRK